MNTKYNLSNKIHIHKYNFKGENEEIFCSSAWNQGIIVNSDSIIRTESIASGTLLGKILDNRGYCKIIDGVCDSKDIAFEVSTDWIELSRCQSSFEKSGFQYQNYKFAEEDFEILVNDYDFKRQFSEMQTILKENNVKLLEMAGNCQYILFWYLNSSGIMDYGFRNTLNVTLLYEKNKIIDCYTEITTGTNIYAAFDSALPQILSKVKCDETEMNQVEDIPLDIEGIIISSDLLAKLIDTFYTTYFITTGEINEEKIPNISKAVSIIVNDPNNKTVGGNINGLGKMLIPQILCKNGKSLSLSDVLRRYDYRENAHFRLDKIRIEPGNKSIAYYYSKHVMEVSTLRGLNESFNPQTFEFVAFISGKEYYKGKIRRRIEATRKINVIKILQSIIDLGNICKYELEGRIMVPDAFVSCKCFEGSMENEAIS